MATADRNWRPAPLTTALAGPRERGDGLIAVDEAGAAHDQVAVVLREALRHPQLAGHVGFFEVERLQGLRSDPLDVPGMKELVRDGVQHVQHHARPSERGGRRDDGAVAVLHAVPAAPGDIVAKKRVRTGLELGELTEHRCVLLHDLLGTRHVLVDLGIASVVVERDADRLLLPVRAQSP